MTRNGNKVGTILATDISVEDNFNSSFNLEFKVNKYNNNKKYHLWDELSDFKLVWCREWNVVFEVNFTTNEADDTVKSATGISLGEAETSQINLYNIQINTEDDIKRDDYLPTVLYNDKNHKASLLHRIMEKAPHYSIKHVDPSISNIQRTFSFDNKSLYDSFQEIAKEINCIFVFDNGLDENGKIKRMVSVYDLENYCPKCGYRDESIDKCPKCGNTDIIKGYGEDTNIFITTENLSDQITFKTDTDSVKNCFRLEAGDDLMTATVISCNPNGSQYIYYISDEMKKDMSKELTSKLSDYDKLYNYYYNEYTLPVESNILSSYNALVNKYSVYKKDLQVVPDSIKGYSSLMNLYYDTIDFYLFLNDTLMPSPEISKTSANKEAAKITPASLAPVAVSDLSKCSLTTASSAVSAMARTIVDHRYQVKTSDESMTEYTWSGKFIITNYSDDEDTATTDTITIEISDNYEKFVKQKIDKVLSKKQDDESTDIVTLFKLKIDSFKNDLKKYCLVSLETFLDSCQACLDLLVEQGIADRKTWGDKNPNLYNEIYLDYYNKMSAIQEEIKVRESEISTIVGTLNNDGTRKITGIQNILDKEKNEIQKKLNLEHYLGTDLWLEFSSYRREDSYQNSNYISDGLNNKDLFSKANEFLSVAKKEIYKSATLQHSISASLYNLLAIKEFEPITYYFSVGNWMRIRIDDNVYKLRLISYTIDFNDLKEVSVKFSDVKICADGISDTESILSQASSMATTYDAVTRQASQGETSNKQLQDWTMNGLSLTKMKIVDNADNQNITWDSHGLLCREFDSISDNYNDKQLKIINKGLYLTDDNWLTSKAGIGEFSYYNPKANKIENSYGVIADTLVGNLILSEEVGVYNTDNSVVMDKNGLTITADNTSNSQNQTILTVQKRTLDKENKEVLTKMMYLDSDCNLVINGSVRINSQSGIDTLTSWVDNNITTATTEVSNNLSGTINENYTTLTNSIEKQSADMNTALSNSVKDLRAEINSTTTNVSNNLSDTIKKNYDTLSDSIKKQSTDINATLSDTVSNLRTEITTATNEVSDNLSGTIKENYDALAGSIERQSNEINTTMSDRVNSLRNELKEDSEEKYNFLWNNIVENQDNLYTTIDEQYKIITKENDDKLNAYKAEVGQFLEFNSSGLTIGASSSNFKTSIDNQGMYFMQGDVRVAYISNNQLYIPNAIIENTLSLGKFFFSPHSNGDGGVSLTWQGD